MTCANSGSIPKHLRNEAGTPENRAVLHSNATNLFHSVIGKLIQGSKRTPHQINKHVKSSMSSDDDQKPGRRMMAYAEPTHPKIISHSRKRGTRNPKTVQIRKQRRSCERAVRRRAYRSARAEPRADKIGVLSAPLIINHAEVSVHPKNQVAVPEPGLEFLIHATNVEGIRVTGKLAEITAIMDKAAEPGLSILSECWINQNAFFIYRSPNKISYAIFQSGASAKHGDSKATGINWKKRHNKPNFFLC